MPLIDCNARLTATFVFSFFSPLRSLQNLTKSVHVGFKGKPKPCATLVCDLNGKVPWFLNPTKNY